MAELLHGFENGRRWIAGEVPFKKNQSICIDTRKGKGLELIVKEMADVVSWLASKMKLPGYTQEDLIQELNVLLILGIAEFDITKGANLSTFLQSHLRKRIVNLYKYATERRRTATHDNYRICKVKCPKCKRFGVFNSQEPREHKCKFCGYEQSAGQPDEVWRVYPVAVQMLSSNVSVSNAGAFEDQKGTIQDCVSYEWLEMLGVNPEAMNYDPIYSIFLQQTLDKQEGQDRLIFKYLMDGWNIQEICAQTGISSTEVRVSIKKIMTAARQNEG